MAQQSSGGGYVFRGQDGSLYLIRDEILDACKMDGDDLKYAQRQDSEKGKSLGGGPFSEIARVDYTDAPRHQGKEPEVQDLRAEGGTTMCGW